MLRSYYSQFTNAVCRVCLNSDGTMYSLFHKSITESNFIAYGDMLNQFANVQAKLDDQLPDHICGICKDALLNCYKFKQQAEESNAILKQDLQPKVFFNNLDELKLKIQGKSIGFEEPAISVTGVNLAVLNGGALANTLIKKVQSNLHSDFDMEVEYLDEEFIQDVPLKVKKKSEPRKVINKKAATVVKENQENSQPRNAINKKAAVENEKEFSYLGSSLNLKVPIPIIISNDNDCSTSKKNKKGPKSNKKSEGYTPKKHKERAKERIKRVCPVCGILTYSLRVHLLTHAEHRQFKCDQCPKTFIQKGNFLVHLKKHTGIKDHVCDVCGAAFYIPKSLKRHKMIHIDEKKFACHLCHKKFYVKCDLARHLKVHLRYKPFGCDDCNMTFNTKQQLDAHRRIHTGERPYSCEICSLKYTYKVNLNNHVFKVHGVNLKFKSIYKITPEVLSELYQSSGLSQEVKKNNKVSK